MLAKVACPVLPTRLRADPVDRGLVDQLRAETRPRWCERVPGAASPGLSCNWSGWMGLHGDMRADWSNAGLGRQRGSW